MFLLESNFSTEFAPGPIAYRAAGIVGAICVIIAGWTTANPTIYRAGLALQAIKPTWKTWRVTMVVGMITTAAACFPALVMKLLSFVALYGLILMPMGAVIFADVYLIPWLGHRRYFASAFGKSLNLAAAAAWLVTMAFSLWLNFYFGMKIFFLGLPGWFVATAVYLLLSWVVQRNLRFRVQTE